ncbi:DUF1015 domain-containing protein [Chloroflexota bacterium]
MTDLRPFRGTHYNTSVINDISQVICPPYDIISPQLQQDLYQVNKNNFIRVEFNRELPQDTTEDNRYTRASSALKEWLEKGILVKDKEPTIYLYDQYFQYKGKEYRRRSIIADVKLEEWDNNIVRPHEGTLGGPKIDRINLIRACHGNTSSILSLYHHPGNKISPLLDKISLNKPLIECSSADGDKHRIWAITSKTIIELIQSGFSSQPVYIADGHHRYESALAYKHEQESLLSSTSGDEPFNFVMMTLIDVSDTGLLVLPPHRLVRGISKANIESLLPKLDSFFYVTEMSLITPGIWQKTEDLLASGSCYETLILFGLLPEKLSILTLKDASAADKLMPFFHTDIYKKLIVSILDHVILEKLLEVDKNGREQLIMDYSYDMQQAVNRVITQEYQLAFLLSPIKVSVVKDIADAGDRMPRKSTYFYPKLPSGLIINKW